eukprot:gene9178-biopygen12193
MDNGVRSSPLCVVAAAGISGRPSGSSSCGGRSDPPRWGRRERRWRRRHDRLERVPQHRVRRRRGRRERPGAA